MERAEERGGKLIGQLFLTDQSCGDSCCDMRVMSSGKNSSLPHLQPGEACHELPPPPQSNEQPYGSTTHAATAAVISAAKVCFYTLSSESGNETENIVLIFQVSYANISDSGEGQHHTASFHGVEKYLYPGRGFDLLHLLKYNF